MTGTTFQPVWYASVVCQYSKVLESIVPDNLLQHLSDAGVLTDAQHGFLPKKSCTSQLLEVMEDWSAAVESGEPVDVAYLDFAKAFDSVPHQRLRCCMPMGLEESSLTGSVIMIDQ